MLSLSFTLLAVLAGIAASAPTDSAAPKAAVLPLPLEPGPVLIGNLGSKKEDLAKLHDTFVGLTDKVAEFAKNFITDVQAGIEDLLKSGKLEELNQELGDDLKVGIKEAKAGLQTLGKAINQHLQKLAESAEKASGEKPAEKESGEKPAENATPAT